MLPRLLSGEEMTVAEAVFSAHRGGRLPVRSFLSFLRVRYAVARVFKNVAVLIRLLAMTPSPTQRAMPSAPR